MFIEKSLRSVVEYTWLLKYNSDVFDILYVTSYATLYFTTKIFNFSSMIFML